MERRKEIGKEYLSQ